ncbi:hypothetical protein M3Y97_00863600 [Aphelenchoides bicaudatus]|nr:hypothetical protein M3Y97_00863600 [Aphelenchoides bicaudatus]
MMLKCLPFMGPECRERILATVYEDDPLFDFSKQSSEDSSAYDEDHNADESVEEHETEDGDEGAITVCREKGVSRCHCDLKERRIDCQREHLTVPDDEDRDDFLIDTTNIKVALNGFKPRYIYLNHNKITEIDPQYLFPGMEDSVEGIDFGLNSIRSIARKAFDKFPFLRKLRLNHNRIIISDKTVGWITTQLGKNLTLLNLAYNGITTLPDGVFDPLHKLEKLILDGNKNIALTAKTFGETGLTSLTMLSLDNCNFVTFPDDLFKNLQQLAYLSLINNPISSIPRAVVSIKSLHVLDLSETAFTSLTSNALKDLASLTRLFMKDMKKMKEFGDCAFCGLTNLTEIDIGGNKQMNKIDENAFGFAKDSADKTAKIAEFLADGCNLTSLPRHLLPWENLNKTVLGNNPWDCESDDMHYFLYDITVTSLAGKDPATLNGTKLAKLIQDNQSGGISSFFKTIFYMGISIGTVGILLVGFLHAHNKYGGIRNVFSRNRTAGVGFNNLNADVGMDDERVFEEDDDDEFEAREPVAV